MVKYVTASMAEFREAGVEEAWMPAELPGSVHTDLLAQGRIPDPFVADNEKRVQWVAERDWEYRVAFHVDAELLDEERVVLVCDGLDTLAEVTFNGHLLGQTENMFRQYRWDVTGALHEGRNEVQLLFHSILQAVLAAQQEEPLPGVSQAIPGGPHVRKAPCQFGWDWGPQLPPIGIWKEIRLEGYSTARLDDVHLRQSHATDGVTIRANVSVERWQPTDLKIVLHVVAPDGAESEAEACLDDSTSDAELSIEIEDPQLWWPNGHGAQPLYAVEVVLYADDRLLDQETLHIGLRTLELRQEPDDFGESFTFVVNGVPIFAKGAQLDPGRFVPHPASATGNLEHLIRSAAQANMNMLRVWGGGFYEEERFYDLCDQYGMSGVAGLHLLLRRLPR